MRPLPFFPPPDRFRTIRMSDAPFAPLVVHARGDIAHVLAARREALGFTCEAFDGFVGWADRYCAKIEHGDRPQGRLGLHFDFPSDFTPGGGVRCSGMGQLWLEALGVRLVLVDAATADAIGARPAPPKPVNTNPAAEAHARKRTKMGRYSAMSASAYEALDRTHVAAEAFRAAVVDHPYITANQALKAEAEAVEEAMRALYQRIGLA